MTTTDDHQPSDTEPLGVAVIGCGYWGVNYLRVMSELPGARLVAICDGSADRLREAAARHPETALVRDVDELLGRSDVDAVVVATGATTHYDVARRCLEAGKHALVEKPLATDTNEALHLVAVAAAQGVVLMVGHTFLFNPAVTRIKSYLDDGTLGDLYYLYARRTNLGPVRQDVNALWDLAPHDVSIFNHLIGGIPEWVSATGARLLQNHREDVGFITLGYAEGIIGNIHVSWADPNKVREVVVVGSERRLLFDDVSTSEPIRLFEKSVSRVDDAERPAEGLPHVIRDGDIISPRIDASEPLKNQCLHFLQCVRTGTRPRTSGEDGAAIVAVMAAITSSVAHHGAPTAVAALGHGVPSPQPGSQRAAAHGR